MSNELMPLPSVELMPLASVEMTRASNVPDLLGRIRPKWQVKGLIGRVRHLLDEAYRAAFSVDALWPFEMRSG